MKNLLLSIATLLFSVSAIAQLYVKPNGTNASYIYVKDQVLFVEDNITLTENSDPSASTERASIYLRDGAQLVQGAGTTLNDGTGYISIYQNSPDSDAWDYTFWGSPVGDQTIVGTGNKNFGGTRFFDVQGLTESTVNVPTGAHNGVVSPMRISNRWLYTYTDALGWDRIYDNSDVLPGRGFTMKGLGTTNHDQNYDFRGRPNKGSIDVPITDDAYTLSGNPYPSALDLNIVFYDNPEIESFRFWDENHSVNSHYYVDNKGGYGVWIPGASDPGGTLPGIYTVAPFLNYDNDGGSIDPNDPSAPPVLEGDDSYKRRFAPVGQGFMLYGASTGTVTYDNSQRVFMKEGVNSNFRRPEGKLTSSEFKSNDGEPAIIPDGSDSVISVTPIPINVSSIPDNRMPRLRLNTYFNETHMRQLVLAFSDKATDGVDRGFDGKSPMDSTSDVYFPITNSEDEKLPYVIQTVPYDITKQIPYTLELNLQSTVLVKTVEEVKFEGSAYLYDNVEGTFQELTNDRYATLVLPAGIYEDRFFITFMHGVKTQEIANKNNKAQVLEDVDFFQNNPAQQLEVGNPEGYDIASANIFGMSGKLVYTASNVGNNSRFTFPTGNLSDGIYLVMLTTKDNITVNYKITVKNK